MEAKIAHGEHKCVKTVHIEQNDSVEQNGSNCNVWYFEYVGMHLIELIFLKKNKKNMNLEQV